MALSKPISLWLSFIIMCLVCPTVTPPSVQPVSPPTVVSTSLAADLEGLTLTDSPLVPSVSGLGRNTSLWCVLWYALVRKGCDGVGSSESLFP